MTPISGSSTVGDDGQIAEDNDAATHSGEYVARQKAAENNTAIDDAVTDDPTGGTRDQVAAKQAANAMGDQDEVNTGYNPPAGAEVPTAENVRRFPELFSQEVIDSFNVPEENDEGGYDESDVAAAEPPDGEETVVDETTIQGDRGY